MTTTRKVPQYCYQCVAGPDFLTVKVEDGVATSVIGFSEIPMRNQFEAWRNYMQAEGAL